MPPKLQGPYHVFRITLKQKSNLLIRHTRFCCLAPIYLSTHISCNSHMYTCYLPANLGNLHFSEYITPSCFLSLDKCYLCLLCFFQPITHLVNTYTSPVLGSAYRRLLDVFVYHPHLPLFSFFHVLPLAFSPPPWKTSIMEFRIVDALL